MTDAKKHEHGPLIAELRESITRNTSGETREKLLARLDQMEGSASTSSFGEHVKALVEEVEEDAAYIAPFMSRLSSLLP
jgi:ABC-type transport system involved in cytochrome bd biosynthesis fused ATPase/permease subunit